MLGCKCEYFVEGFNNAVELIDTCWDVNVILSDKVLSEQPELIDTCWDVNIKSRSSRHCLDRELIDTCWDVNFLKGGFIWHNKKN